MVLEKDILPFLQWLAEFAGLAAIALAMLVLLASLAAYLITAIRSGPVDAFSVLWRTLVGGLRDLRDFSLRRTRAIASLAIRESLRRYVLVVFAIFAVILLLAGWYLDAESDNPSRLYISFALRVTNFLVILLAIFLSTFSLPADIKNRTIYTVVTKPVRGWEIVLGRIAGFACIGTLVILLMCLVSYFFVVRGLQHDHSNDVAALQPSEDQQGWVGQTTYDNHHRHAFSIGDENSGETEAKRGHYHPVLARGSGEEAQVEVGSPAGALIARVPQYGELTFFDRDGSVGKGINVGKEWTYRGYIEGGTLAAAKWHFSGLRSRDFLSGIPIEMMIRVFRTYKGEIELGIRGSMEIQNPNPALKSNDPAVLAELAKQDVAVKSRAINFTANEFTPESRTIPRRIEAQMLDGSWRTVDLFEYLVHDGEIDLVVRCDEKAQYFGMAKADLYIRAADNFFWANFIKSYITLWLQMIIVVSVGVMFSTFLTGSVALLATLSSIIMGYFSQTIVGVATGELKGGGPVESLIRIFKQDNLITPLEGGASTVVVQYFDWMTMAVMRAVSILMPNFRDFAESGGINTARFVAYGFDIPINLMWQHVLTTGLYVFVAVCAGYFFLKSKEVAA